MEIGKRLSESAACEKHVRRARAGAQNNVATVGDCKVSANHVRDGRKIQNAAAACGVLQRDNGA